MISKSKRHKKIAVAVALTLLLVNVGFLCWYLFVGYQAGFHSDSAAKVLIAREIVETGSYFPNDWNYVNGDLFVLFGHTFIIPLLSFMPAGFKVHAISGLISSTLILSGIWFLTGITQISTVRRILIVSLVAAGISGFMAENLFGQASYGAVVYFSCYLLFFSWEFLNTDHFKKTIWAIGVFIVVTLAHWANPQRAMISYSLPLIATLLLVHFKYNFIINAKKNVWQLLCIVSAGIICGFLLHVITLSGVHNVLGAGHARWLTYELMIRNLCLTPKGIIATFGGLPVAESVLVSTTGIYEAIRLVTALIIVFFIPTMIVNTMKHRISNAVFLAIFALFAFSAVFFLQITTSIPDMTDPVQSSRYFVPSLLIGLLLLLSQPLDFLKQTFTGIAVIIILAVLLTSAYPSLVASGLSSNFNWGMPGQLNTQHKKIADFLAKNHLKYGYATYWNAGVISVLSKEKCLVRQIVLDAGIPMPMRHLSSNRWYRASTWQGNSFLLLTQKESATVDWKQLAEHGVKPVQKLEFDGYNVYVFTENLAKYIPGWDLKYETPSTFHVNEKSLHQVGRFVENTEHARTRLIAEKEQVGALHYGPYVDVEPGRYAVTFDVFANYNPAGSVRLDVAAAPDQKLYGERILTSSNNLQTIVITIDKTRTMEFRVWALGRERVIFKGVTIQRVDEK